MQTASPRSRRWAATAATRGVLPVPPQWRFPTLSTGRGRRRARRPYQRRRRPWAPPYRSCQGEREGRGAFIGGQILAEGLHGTLRADSCATFISTVHRGPFPCLSAPCLAVRRVDRGRRGDLLLLCTEPGRGTRPGRPAGAPAGRGVLQFPLGPADGPVLPAAAVRSGAHAEAGGRGPDGRILPRARGGAAEAGPRRRRGGGGRGPLPDRAQHLVHRLDDQRPRELPLRRLDRSALRAVGAGEDRRTAAVDLRGGRSGGGRDCPDPPGRLAVRGALFIADSRR